MTPRKEEGELGVNDEESKQLSESEENQRTLHRANQQQRLVKALLITTIVAWALGKYDSGTVWIIALLVWVYLWWKNSTSRIIDLAAKEAEIETRRRQAMSNAETAEWVNFLINRW